ncbi:hypothetical protein [Paludibacterium yongneupense]|uniref:hypothetical protein n=1 Tax=Paludibacterium yongneupense TaxID=400061 RepID=UPI00048DC2A1|nr:hypothetical protein [Paludibacterium yongneupense]
MKKVLDKFTASGIALVLNKRGFVTHDDFPICTDNDFSALLKSKVITLRNNGYIGGRLKPWSTGFRQKYWTYGVMDEDWELTEKWLDAYTTVTGGEDGCLSLSGLSIGDLSKLLLGLTFHCSEGHETRVDSNLYSFVDRKKLCSQAYSVCASCGEEISKPFDVYRLF